ncbi:MAG: hypothetical protein H8D45_20755 [Bacteroidetes bacterium]|nr:hypothetical protein [Bacteroidota bacterium]MBL7105327.1 hypothetical protein [Bacteroidales bacterium]
MKTLKKTNPMIFVTFWLMLTFMLAMSFQNVNGQLFNDIKSLKSPLTDDLLILTAVGNGYSDQTIIIFIPDATAGFDSDYDAYKLPGIYAAPQLYSIIPCCNLAVNALPEITTNLEVQLGFEVGYDTTYTISATCLYTFDPSVTIHMEDTKDNVFINLMTDSVYTFTANPSDDPERFKLYFNYTLFVDLKVFLEGPYSGTEMNTNLNSGGYIPLSQPYNTIPWNYNGSESVVAIPNSDITDWVLVELRDATDAGSANNAAMFDRQAGFLLKNGTIAGLDGASNLEFHIPYLQNLYIVVWHRNHLGIMSAYPVTESGGIYSYDFSSGVDQVYGGVHAHKNLGGGVYGMIGGDGDANGIINNADKTSIWWIIAGKRGYEAGDYNLNGQINNKDKNNVWLINIGSTSQVPN